MEAPDQQSFIDERILSAKELRAENSRSEIQEGDNREVPPSEGLHPDDKLLIMDDYMSDDAFDTMASSSAAAATPSQQQDSLILSAKELRANPVDKREAPPSEGLTAHWKRTKVTGKGVDLLENIANLFDDDTVLDNERAGFLQVRLMAPKTKKTPARKPVVCFL